ncbi:MAG TPA: flagellar hook-length control protein FliK [Nocardioidaceae bacterium]|nr:flagellar hook-length control protein FliK [Nocardioidaceae bacterium]
MTPPLALTPGVASPGTPSVPGVVGSAAPGTGAPGAEGFGAFVAAALAAVPGAPAQAEAVTSVAAGATAAADLPGEAGALVEPGAELEEPDAEKAAQLLGVVVPVALLAVVPVPVAAGAEAATGTTDESAAVLPSAGATPSEPAAAEGASESESSAASPVVAAATSQGTSDQSEGQDRGGSTPARPEPVAETRAATSPTAPAVAAPEAARTVTSTGASSRPDATGPVARQTFPEVTRLMSRGDGTHRITLHLRPEGLGEVRVVLTMKEGKVDVRMTSSTEARHSLSSDLPELHRLLAAAGATETSVSVRDAQQLVSSSWEAGRSTAASSQDLLGEAGTGQPRHHENPQQAGTSADHIATDGARDRARASGPIDPATGTRTAGLDVTV